MFERLRNELKTINPRRSLLAVFIVVLVAYALTMLCIPADADGFGAWSLVPAIFLVVYIFGTKRILEALILSAVIALIMVNRTLNILVPFSDTVTDVMLDPDMAYLIIVCGTMGCVVRVIEKSGGAVAFGEWAASKAKGKKSALIWTWLLGIVIFMDDYLNSLTVGSCMTKLTDKHKVSREMLSYVVDSTAAPLCVLIPISTWAAFAGKLLEKNGWAPDGEGLVYFIKTIPYNFYGWIAAIMVPLVVLGIIPLIGPMKKAEKRVQEGGPVAPPGSEKIDIHAGENLEYKKKPNIINLLIPVASMIGFTVYFDVDLQIGVLATVAVCFILYLAQGLMDAEEFANACIEGLQSMIMPLMLMVLAWVFAAVNDEIGFTQFVIESVSAHVSLAFLPFALFCTLAFTEFITGTNWGMYIIALPIVIPLATVMGANMPLCVAAVLSAGVLGSHCCFYSDATVITSAATGCENFAHAYSQMFYGLLAGAISAVGFLITGFVFA